MIDSIQKSNLISVLSRTGYFFFAIPVGLVILLAVWLTAAAAYENEKFMHSTDQLLFLIGTVRNDASKDTSFGQGTGEDLIDDLVRQHQLAGSPVNGWGGGLRAAVPIQPFMRVEDDVPVHACRQLAFFFGKDPGALGLQKMEARKENGDWTTIYDASLNIKELNYRSANGACGDGSYATFAMTLRLR